MPPKQAQKAAASPAKTEEKKTEQPKQEAKPAAAPAPAKTEEKKAAEPAKPAAAAAPAAAAKKDEKKAAEPAKKAEEKKAAEPAKKAEEKKAAEPAKQDAKPAAAAKKEEKKPEPKKEEKKPEPKKEQVVEEDEDDDEEDDEEMPSLDNQEGQKARKQKVNRGESKNRKALSKLGFKSTAPAVTKVTIKLRGTYISIDVPDVSQSPAKDAFLIFGTPQVVDPNKDQAKLMEQLKAMQAMSSGATDAASTATTDAAKPAATDAPVDETGIDAKDIELVMTQANCSRAKAVEALRKNNKDVVNSIMTLMS